MTKHTPGRSLRTPPTMADVAARAGVSAMTVSRALKGGSSVADGTRRRILEIVDSLGYVLDQTAGTLSSKQSGFIAALIPSLNNSNFSDTTRGISEATEPSGLQLLVGSTDYLLDKEEQLIESMLRRRPEGIIVTGARRTGRARTLLASAGVPVIETWEWPAEPIEHVVGFSNAASARAMVHHLHGLGYRNIGFIGGDAQRDPRGADRRAGYAEAVAELRLPKGRVMSLGHPALSMEHGQRAIVSLLTRWPDIDAVMCVSDLTAFGALAECQRRNWAVPHRIAIAGFGDFEHSRFCQRRLTTISVDALGIGRAAGDLMLRAIQAARSGKAVSPESIPMPYAIVQRETT